MTQIQSTQFTELGQNDLLEVNGGDAASNWLLINFALLKDYLVHGATTGLAYTAAENMVAMEQFALAFQGMGY